MKLESEFIRLPLKFDVERLQYELAQFDDKDWLPHPNNFKGNNSIPLISTGGTANDLMSGEMKPTEHLNNSPYFQQIMDAFGEVFGRSRLMSLDGGCEVSQHSDLHYHWFDRVRIHIPIVTNDKVIFHCGNEKIHMAVGEAWLFDAWKPHKVVNHSNKTRTHLVLDTCGSSKFWDMVNQSEFFPNGKHTSIQTQMLSFQEGKKVNILCEKFNTPGVMAPGEVNYLVQDLIDDAKRCPSNDKDLLNNFIKKADGFRKDWRKIWSLYKDLPEGHIHYQKLIQNTLSQDTRVRLGSIDESAQFVLGARILIPALNLDILKHEDSKPKLTRSVTPTQKQESSNNSSVLKENIKQPLSRNSLCFCGSKKKYKHCCG